MGIKVNLEGVSTSQEPFDGGNYPSTFTSFKMGKTKPKPGETPKDKVDVTFTLGEGPAEGRKLTRTYTLSEKAYWAFKNLLIVLGSDPDDLEGEIDVEEELQQHIGTEVVLVVIQETYDDPQKGPRPVNKIADVKDATASELFA